MISWCLATASCSPPPDLSGLQAYDQRFARRPVPALASQPPFEPRPVSLLIHLYLWVCFFDRVYYELGECRSHLNALSTCALISSSSLDLMLLRTSAWSSSCCLMSLRRASTSWFVVSYNFFDVKARPTAYGKQHTYPDGRPMKNSEYSSKTEQASILFIPLSTTTQRIEAVNWDLHLF